tara:strand:+ start:103 stop:342 length:240 start_codon:yes stop_codon:yes gene_type:complete
MNYRKYRNVYYNEVDQKVWRTSSKPENNNFVLLGQMTITEYELLIEILDEVYDGDEINNNQFTKTFNEFKNFLDYIKKI